MFLGRNSGSGNKGSSGSQSSALYVPPTLRSESEILQASNAKSFTFNELKNATRNFHPESVVGEGGFGSVFKVWIDEHTFAPAKPRTPIVFAVKKLNLEGFQGHIEWLAEVDYLGRLYHPNLVKLIGYCLEDENRLLVYEFMPRGSLENHLYRRGSYFQPLSWNIRMKIALGAARGLTFLHSPKVNVIYRDFKTSNVLLDSHFNPKLCDFGLAIDGPTDDKSHVSTTVSGTFGYAAPEYIATGHLTTKCDVYGFGVVLLEMLSGRRSLDLNRPSGEHNLVEWARPYLASKGRLFRILDPQLEGQYTIGGAQKAATLAYQCLSYEPKYRPAMDEAVTLLEGLQNAKDMARNPSSERKVSSQKTHRADGYKHWHRNHRELGHGNLASPVHLYVFKKIKKFKFSTLLPWGLPKLRSTLSTSQNYKINKRKEPTKWDGITTFAYSALVQATSNFNKSNQLGEGGFGKVYKGDLLSTKVAIKILHREGDASQEQAFRREVDTLCRVSHPHLVQLMGVCPEKYALVYEFMEGGTLEDRLVRKDIPWQDRILIATEICSALVFLHSRKPDIVVHGDLKPANILLDASGLSKLGDFGICRIIPPSNTTTTAHITATSLQGSDGYMDPVLKQNSKLQPSIDVYAFGMIALRLLTNDRPGHGLVIDVEEALSEKRLKVVLDPTAGWPSQLAEELSDLAVMCCDLRVKRRPHLQEVWEKLEEMRNKASSA